eukprot:scaffold55567_cov28-Tisochrysis_lutea.AAC.1
MAMRVRVARRHGGWLDDMRLERRGAVEEVRAIFVLRPMPAGEGGNRTAPLRRAQRLADELSPKASAKAHYALGSFYQRQHLALREQPQFASVIACFDDGCASSLTVFWLLAALRWFSRASMQGASAGALRARVVRSKLESELRGVLTQRMALDEEEEMATVASRSRLPADGRSSQGNAAALKRAKQRRMLADLERNLRRKMEQQLQVSCRGGGTEGKGRWNSTPWCPDHRDQCAQRNWSTQMRKRCFLTASPMPAIPKLRC